MFDLTKAKARYTKAKQAYFNGDAEIMTDAEFDILENKIRKADPNWKGLHETGASVKHKAKVLLHKPMPSLNKCYPDAIDKWLAKNGPVFVTMQKLDGTALQLVVRAGKKVALHTRGDGSTGKDVSHLLPHVGKSWKFPKNLDAVFRIEGVMKKAVFEKKWSAEFDNARQCANGVYNRKEPHPALADVDLVVLGVYGMTIPEGLTKAQDWGMSTVYFNVLKRTNAKTLTEMLERTKNEGDFEVDGLVVASTNFTLDYRDNEKPKSGIVAFKVNAEDEMVEATVEKIIWQVTGRGRIVPKIKIAPTKMNGVMVQHATAHNAKLMKDKKIGPGAVVKMVRSGGVIPYIVEVVKPGKLQWPTEPHRWNGVHLVVDTREVDSGNAKARIRVLNLAKFFTTMGIEGIKGKTLTDLHDFHTLKTWWAYADLWKKGKLVSALKPVMGANALKVNKEFDRVFSKPVPARQFLVAIQVYDVGIGERKLAMIEGHGISLKHLLKPNLAELLEVPGFAMTTAGPMTRTKTVEAVNNAVATANEYFKLDWSLPEKKKAPTKGKLLGEKVSFTSYRDKEHEAAVEAAGGELISYGAKTTILLYKEGGKASSKVEAARAKGIRVCTFEELKL